MSKYRVFKCKKDYCYCGGSWVIEHGGWALSAKRTHAEAIAYVQRIAA